ncbi:hypothetical protein K788_0001329 (plasmid) [Paraburkholderia caribensis MBA4]|uniref:Uncharacterized protein n=1 Tax=Paraburkholderia caribensis MBA4 TaxID=1323664 RepID=A0A0P0RMV9_9BURK|nr:hypothetical protein K788_0001329 [Paraburkholderia caribensis MBA4]
MAGALCSAQAAWPHFVATDARIADAAVEAVIPVHRDLARAM